MRINIIPVSLLTDVHLRAEYREILMAPHYFFKSLNSKSGIDWSKVSDSYTLNKGHAYMWYNKFAFIKERHDLLQEEMIRRGFSIRSEDKISPLLEQIPSELFNGFVASYNDFVINVERVLDKIYSKHVLDNKPYFYKLNGVDMSFDEWKKFYSDFLNEVN